MKTKIYMLILFITNCIFAQEIEPIEADRPDQTETPAIVPEGMFQMESGFTFQKNDAFSRTNSLPSTLWKYGINKNMELRLITEFVYENINDEKHSGLNPILIGCKIKISDEKGIIPRTSFIGHIALPKFASSRYKADYVAPEFRFTMQHTLTENLSLGYNLGAEWNGFSPEPTFIYTLTSGYMISEKIGFYAEIFGFAPQNETAYHNIDGGFTYLINNNFMVDLSSGFGITTNAPKHYFALGFSFRI
ncbi:transporter [Flavobacterium sp. SUN052]|uniref:transporter n=1 Tax=Flavobacterium sp. SUN052 TaxID=3002441 RepID=UPI00237EDE22|nr:transporter [Flavobacterium sp. SUN052]MEC4003404.1 transporter [Flavobacterium sp. SUN052]